MGWAKNGVKSRVCPSVCHLISIHTSGAKDLKIGMHIPHMDGSKVTHQIFDIFPRS